MEAKQKTIYQDFADALREYAPKVSSNKNFVESDWSYDSRDLVTRIYNFRDTLMNAEKAEINKKVFSGSGTRCFVFKNVKVNII